MMRTYLSFLTLAASVSAATISIAVGKNGALNFSPDSVTAATGDILEFHFYSGSGGHSVVSSTFSTPCQPATDAFFSGYIPGNDSGDMTFVTTVNSTDPIWFYCSLPGHCQTGMVGVVNPPSGQTVADYAAAAAKVAGGSAPASIQGGVLTTINPSAATSSMSTASSSEMSMTSTTAAATHTNTGESTATTSAAKSTNTNTGEASSSTSASASAATTTTKSSAGVGIRERSDIGALLGLAVFAGGLVALMA